MREYKQQAQGAAFIFLRFSMKGYMVWLNRMLV